MHNDENIRTPGQPQAAQPRGFYLIMGEESYYGDEYRFHAVIIGPVGMDLLEVWEQFKILWDHGEAESQRTMNKAASERYRKGNDAFIAARNAHTIFLAACNAWRFAQGWVAVIEEGDISRCDREASFVNWLVQEHGCVPVVYEEVIISS